MTSVLAAIFILAVLLLLYDLRRRWSDRRMGASSDGQALPPGFTRVHIFSGVFDTEADLFAYCFTPITDNGPEPLNLDLPEASVNTRFVEAAFDDQIQDVLSQYLPSAARARFSALMRDDNALLLIFEAAFDGLDYRLHNTPRLRHLGFETLALPAQD